MNKNEFLKELLEELEVEQPASFDTKFTDLDVWESMSAMILIGFVADSFDINLTADDIKKLTTIESLIERIGIDKFD